MKSPTMRLAAAMGLAFTLGSAVRADSYSSVASGNYNVNATWGAAANPGGGTVADTVTVNSPHAVTVTAAYDASNDVITVNSGAILKTPEFTVITSLLAS